MWGTRVSMGSTRPPFNWLRSHRLSVASTVCGVGPMRSFRRLPASMVLRVDALHLGGIIDSGVVWGRIQERVGGPLPWTLRGTADRQTEGEAQGIAAEYVGLGIARALDSRHHTSSGI